MNSEPIDLLVRADYLYPMSDGRPVVRDGEVAIRNSRIVYAGPRRPSDTWHAARVLDGENKAVLPGFVNCHTHAASLIFRSRTDDARSGTGLYDVAFRMEKSVPATDWELLAQLGCLDLLRAGVTTINDIWYEPDGLARAAEAAGLRAIIANKIFDVRLEHLHRGDYTRYPAQGAARLRHNVGFVERWHGAAGGRITCRIGPHATDTCDAGLHREIRAEATRLGVGLHLHAAQSPRETAYIRQAYDLGPLEFMHHLGVLGPDVILAHLTFATDADLDAVHDAGAAYAHCPTIYPRRGKYPALMALLERGITTGFATDWMLNDPFEGMRYAMNSVKLLHGNPDLLSSSDALWLHTVGSARALGIDHEVGSLETGKKADLIAVDLAKPHLQPYYGEYPALVYYAKSSDVVTSVVDGEVLLENGHPSRGNIGTLMTRISQRLPEWKTQLESLAEDHHSG